MIVTIKTRAEIDPEIKETRYQFYIKCEKASIIQMVSIIGVLDHEEAELMCIKSALSVLLDSGITGITKVIINQE